jgi:hypothetical protein
MIFRERDVSAAVGDNDTKGSEYLAFKDRSEEIDESGHNGSTVLRRVDGNKAWNSEWYL